jgi:hypothetical protein
MEIVCKNCNHKFEGNYCNSCGQSAETHKLNLHFIWHDIQHGLFHFDKGVLYTTKELFTRPGNSIREFIDGKRVKHFKPISLVIIVGTIYSILFKVFHLKFLKEETVQHYENLKNFDEWTLHHYTWIILLSIPFFTFSSYILFKKQGYNLVEHFILNCFIAAQRMIFKIAFLLFFEIFLRNHNIVEYAAFLFAMDLIFIFWSYYTFFNKMNKLKLLVLTLISSILSTLLILIFATLMLYFYIYGFTK